MKKIKFIILFLTGLFVTNSYASTKYICPDEVNIQNLISSSGVRGLNADGWDLLTDGQPVEPFPLSFDHVEYTARFTGIKGVSCVYNILDPNNFNQPSGYAYVLTQKEQLQDIHFSHQWSNGPAKGEKGCFGYEPNPKASCDWAN